MVKCVGWPRVVWPGILFWVINVHGLSWGNRLNKLGQFEADYLKNLDKTFSKCNNLEIRELTISQTHRYFHSGQLTSVELTKCYLDRISQMNPYLKAVLEVNPNAIKEAENADELRKSGKAKIRGLHGIPVILKDNIGTKDYMETTAGSKVLLGIRPKNDAAVVKTLKRAGAVILGKANLSELAGYRGYFVPPGWSGRGGITRNPYNLSAETYGSSSGSAVSVAANLAMVAVATETDGSIMGPAKAAGVLGMKPTLGAVSMEGVIPISKTQDCVGPMARTVEDLAILFDGMNSKKRKLHRGCNGSFHKCLLNESLKEKQFRVGIARCPGLQSDHKILAIPPPSWESECSIIDGILSSVNISSKHVYVQDSVKWDMKKLIRITPYNEDLLLRRDFKQGINHYLANEVYHNTSAGGKNKKQITSLQDIVDWNDEHCNEHGQERLRDALAAHDDEEYKTAKKTNRRAARRLLMKMMDRDNLDVILFPTLASMPTVRVPFVYWGYSLAAIAGYPAIHIPTRIRKDGYRFNGVTLVGRPDSERTLLQIAHLIEKRHPARHPPNFLS